MIARVLEGEIDALRMSLDDAVDIVRSSVVPALRDQEGYRGMYLLLTDEGKALAISLWSTEEAAEAGVVESRPLYEDQLEQFAAIYRAAPGRETYRVALADPHERKPSADDLYAKSSNGAMRRVSPTRAREDERTR